jgi:hypothetical protein
MLLVTTRANNASALSLGATSASAMNKEITKLDIQ